MVRFANLEAVPEKTDISDFFSEVSLFKMNPALLRLSSCGAATCGEREKSVLSCSTEEEGLFTEVHASSFATSSRGRSHMVVRQERAAICKLIEILHDIGELRRSVLKCLSVQLPPVEPDQAPQVPWNMYEDEPLEPEEPMPRKHDVPSFFNSYGNGKVAVRCCVGPPDELPPLPLGVHGFVRDNGAELHELQSKGPGAPVVLHYANCGLHAWKQKYRTLCRGHGTSDGAFSTAREGISSVRAHLAARQLTLRGKTDELETFYVEFVQGNEHDELAYLAQHGVVLRLRQPAARLAQARRQWEMILRSGTTLQFTRQRHPPPDNFPPPASIHQPPYTTRTQTHTHVEGFVYDQNVFCVARTNRQRSSTL